MREFAADQRDMQENVVVHSGFEEPEADKHMQPQPHKKQTAQPQ